MQPNRAIRNAADSGRPSSWQGGGPTAPATTTTPVSYTHLDVYKRQTRHRDDLAQKGVRIRFAGRRDWRVPKRLLRHMDDSVALTEANRKMTLTICFNYGGRAEIVDAVRQLVADGVDERHVDERAIASRLYFPDMPDPDLVIRCLLYTSRCV